VPPVVGDSVEFDLVSESGVRGRSHAERVEILPPGTAQFEEVFEGRVKGRIEVRLQRSGASGGEPFGGWLREVVGGECGCATRRRR
jgi:hypothetical protein